MKRIGNLFYKIISLENLQLADSIARKGKAKQSGIKDWDKNKDANLLALHHDLVNKTYTTSPYQKKLIYEPKEREISILPYRDRIVHHAIMLHLEPVFNAMFISHTYSSIKDRGIHGAANDVTKALKDVEGTQYCLKLDIQKFYPSIDHNILKAIVRRKIKDIDLLRLLDDIIDSAPGLPIGNYLSAYFANLYLTPFDHYLKEQTLVRNYFRYADDIVILHHHKPYLHALRYRIELYLQDNLRLTLKHNYRVFQVKEGIDFVGYVFYHTHIRLRKTIKQSFARMISRSPRPESIAAYYGWAKHCNSLNLLKKLLPHEQVQRLQHKHSKTKL
ncbi:reverse transcriptase/maturase family protein [Mucilaginibacter gossypii]|uniref:reverse transcriptase/maturase family protein n=1 Tax=Mucilaginibacter gossypii TaxID=551996 RepID=UPI000DCF3460|nr:MULTISPECIES: reverse transcriptase/maturase family protein [Mucilaginibacter]QTE36007.1 reverse transcriptase/maturase family protein [Mucilaginibacter gossypii]RAV56681.1 reverse transcriptase [Mucilaginibacter rubeus]